MSMSKTVTVWSRTRPDGETEERSACAHDSPTQLRVDLPERGKSFVFNFDRVIDGDATQEDVFQSGVPEIVDQVFSGRPLLVATYGQTSSGKTYTMIGDLDEDGGGVGLLPRAMRYCFDRATSQSLLLSVQIQMMEIYNEEIRDLLCLPGTPSKIQIRHDAQFGTAVEGLTLISPLDYSEAMEHVREGLERRSTSETRMNKSSSRSHVLCYLVLSDLVSGKVISQLGLADLAGSERQAKTGAAGSKLREGGSINKSLSTLERVVNEIQTHQRQKRAAPTTPPRHVNYRDSKLTRVLQPFLSGRGHALFILCASPLQENAQETLNTMKFGQRLQGISQAVIQEIAPVSPQADTPGPRTDISHDRARETFARAFLRECAWSLLGLALYLSASKMIRLAW